MRRMGKCVKRALIHTDAFKTRSLWRKVVVDVEIYFFCFLPQGQCLGDAAPKTICNNTTGFRLNWNNKMT